MHALRTISRLKPNRQDIAHLLPIPIRLQQSIQKYRTKTPPKSTLPTSKSLSTTTLIPTTISPPAILTALTQPSTPTITTSLSQIQPLPPHPVILPGSSHHTCLQTFLSHADSTNLSPKSPTYIGTYYEYLVLQTLLPYGFNLTRTGRTADAGIDLLGTWILPTGQSLRVIVQCKSHARALRPEHIRELEGAVAGAPIGFKGGLGVLVGRRQATKGVRERIGSSEVPLAYVMVDHDECDGGGGGGIGKVRQFLWNHVAQDKGLEGMGVTLQYRDGIEEVEREIALTWNGWVVKRAASKAEGSDGQMILTELPTQVSEDTKKDDEKPKKRGRPRKIAVHKVVAEVEVKKKKVPTKKIKPLGQKKKK